jgi:hypothetical protein
MHAHWLHVRVAAAVSLALPAAGLAAQEPQHEVQLSASGGLTWGGRLWSVAVQPTYVPMPGVSALDTFALARHMSPRLSAWVGITRFVQPHVGVGAELAWVAASVATSCHAVAPFYPDPDQTNELVCGSVGGRLSTNSAIAALATFTLRAAPRRDVSPYVKAGLGLAMLSGSFVVTGANYSTAACPNCYKEIYAPDSRSVTWAGTAAAGLMFGGGLPIRFRVELRDFVLGLPVVTGTADPVLPHPAPPSRLRAIHRLTFAMGLDLVSGGPRKRRY